MKPASKKIIIVFNSLDIGGIETKIVDLCSYYSSRPHTQLFLLLKNQKGLFLPSLPENIQVISPKIPSFSKLKAISFPFWLSSVFKKIQPDLIVAFGNYSSVSAAIAKRLSASKSKLIISEDSSIIEQINAETFPLLRKHLVKLTYPAADKIITLTSAGQSKLLSLVPNIESKIIIHPNWLPLSFPKTKPSTSKRTIDILFLGRFEPQKNPLKFLKIIKRLAKTTPKITAVMIGYGSLQSQIEKYIQKYHLQNYVSLKSPSVDKIFYLQNSRILLLTSDHEGFPLTILESLALNCLPVCRQLPEINDYFSKYSYPLLYQNTQKAVSQIKFLLTNQKIQQEISGFYQPLVFKDQLKNFTNTVKLFDSLL